MNPINSQNTRAVIPRALTRASVFTSAFTLVEVMISLVLVLIVVFGVSQVFTMSSQTIGAGQALSTSLRDSRAFQSTAVEDFKAAASDSPVFIMSMAHAFEGIDIPPDKIDGNDVRRGYMAGFRNKKEHDADQDGNPLTYDGNGDGREDPNNPQDVLRLLQTSDRNPRLDRLAFFAHSRFTKQTEPPGGRPLDSRGRPLPPPTANEALIWYGHLGQDGKQTGAPFWMPNNQYAENRILGRACILLNPDAPALEGVATSDKNTDDPPKGTPFARNALSNKPYNNTDIRYSRNDLVLLSIDQVRAVLEARYAKFPTYDLGQFWFDPFWDGSTAGKVTDPYRFTVQPTMSRPLNHDKLARTSTYFVGNCTQFIVEYAGDYLFQDPGDTASTLEKRGRIHDGPSGQKGVKAYRYLDKKANGPDPKEYVVQYGETDGEIDWIWDPATGTKRIRWYGAPRDVTGPEPDPSNPSQMITRIDMKDVVPLWFVLNYQDNEQYDDNRIDKQNFVSAPWEIPPFPQAVMGKPDENSDFMAFKFDETGARHPRNFKYNCVFRNDAPPLIRITIKIDDPSNRLQEGQWYQFVLTR